VNSAPAEAGIPLDDRPGRSAAQREETARRAVRHVASGVSVLTIAHHGIRRGITVSSLFAMSRDPLQVGMCLRPTSSFAAIVRAGRSFSVNVLRTEQVELARRFADPDRPKGDAQFHDVQWEPDGATGAPLIAGCLAHFACRAEEWHRIGDHDLIVATVVGGAPSTDDGLPLLTFAGGMLSATPPMDSVPLTKVRLS